MRLSESIRLGAMATPQAFGVLSRTRRRWFFGLIGPVVREACALGAAYAAATDGRYRSVVAEADSDGFRGAIKAGETFTEYETPSEWYPVLMAQLQCPQCDEVRAGRQLIPHLNDDHRWTREQIALFVERVEVLVLSVRDLEGLTFMASPHVVDAEIEAAEVNPGRDLWLVTMRAGDGD